MSRQLVLCLCAVTVSLAAAWEEGPVGLSLTSSAFREAGAIPGQYTCDGADRSPPLAWSGVPEGTITLALLADDPDAPGGTWVHWVLYDVPATLSGLPEAVATVERPSGLAGAVQGRNDFGRLGYGGPCPPPGPAHRYVFTLVALATKVGLGPGASKQQVDRAMSGHVLATAQLVGTYARARR
jgi:Raf kinase inhibitor-like YbhB/YbcL family protein